MNLENVQTLVLRAPKGGAVVHQILRIPEGKNTAETARRLLDSLEMELSFGVNKTSDRCTSIGISFAGLEALKVPESYLRLFVRLAPAFTQGAVRRSVNVGDSGASAPLNWEPGFRQERAHVLLSWHGPSIEDVRRRADEFASAWEEDFEKDTTHRLDGARLGAPPGQQGQWVHFGFRDGLSEVCIEKGNPSSAPDCRDHAPGALLLGRVNDADFNTFALTRAPGKVRAFFHDSSFGILRKIEQDLKAFEDRLEGWRVQLEAAVVSGPVSRDFVKAKLCGRWPDGRQLHPGDVEEPSGDLALDLTKDTKGEGCPFGSHVRRMRAAPDADGNRFDRPLQRRGIPFGLASWSGPPKDADPRGLLGQFFCASIEDQFEHLLVQWAIRPPLGFSSRDRALDPFGGSYQGADAALGVPLMGRDTQWLKGFSSWTTTKGTMYAWHPSRTGLGALLIGDFVPVEDERPWL
jgi:deferrochelatase/peroxidase EfeB